MAAKDANGMRFECRVARLLVAEGGLVRRRVNLDAQFGERVTITDVDVLGFFFSPTLDLRAVAGECKTTEARSAPSAGDRLLWSAGLGRLVKADQTFVAVSKRARDSERNVASLVGAELIDIRDLERREQVLGIGPSDPYGPHDPRLASLRVDAKRLAKSDEDIRRLELFVTSELWLAPPVPALKKALGAARRLGERWSANLPDAERIVVEWMLSEAIVGTTLALARLAGTAYRQPEDTFARHLNERLAEGLADYQALREISRQADKVFTSMATKLGVDPARTAEVLGFFEPKPPPYAESLTELVERLARKPGVTAQLPRLADARYAVSLGADGSTEDRLGDTESAGRLLRLVATFMEGQIRVPRPMLEPLRSSAAQAADGGEDEESSPTLFQGPRAEAAPRRAAG